MSYSLHNLDILMLEYINYEKGFFIEAGANDGISQSNTYYYERNMGWIGLLVEPNPIKCSQCKINRPNSIVENYALVSSNFKNKTISGDFSHLDAVDSLMSMVVEDGDYTDDNLLYHKNKKIRENEIIEVDAITLNELLTKHKISTIDFFSLDVEGYELSVLNGLDLSQIRPKYILIETANKEEYQKAVREYMVTKNYSFIKPLSGNDDLFVDNNLI